VNSVNQISRYNEQYAIEAVASAKQGVKLQDGVHFINQLNNQMSNDSNIIYSEQTKMLIDSTSSFTLFIVISGVGLYLLMSLFLIVAIMLIVFFKWR
jgi:multidrug efflux pump subunit AcrB